MAGSHPVNNERTFVVSKIQKEKNAPSVSPTKLHKLRAGVYAGNINVLISSEEFYEMPDRAATMAKIARKKRTA